MFAEKRRTPKMTIKTQNETLAEVGAELCCIIPPYVLDHLAQSSDAKIRQLAIDAIAHSSSMRRLWLLYRLPLPSVTVLSMI